MLTKIEALLFVWNIVLTAWVIMNSVWLNRTNKNLVTIAQCVWKVVKKSNKQAKVAQGG